MSSQCDTYRIHWIATVTAFPRDDKKHHTQFPSMEGCRAAAGWSENSRKYYHAHTLSCHARRSEAIQSIMHARMRDSIITGSPRSHCSPAMIKSTTPSSPPLEGCRAAAGWSENSRKCCILIPPCHPGA